MNLIPLDKIFQGVKIIPFFSLSSGLKASLCHTVHFYKYILLRSVVSVIYTQVYQIWNQYIYSSLQNYWFFWEKLFSSAKINLNRCQEQIMSKRQSVMSLQSSWVDVFYTFKKWINFQYTW